MSVSLQWRSQRAVHGRDVDCVFDDSTKLSTLVGAQAKVGVVVVERKGAELYESRYNMISRY